MTIRVPLPGDNWADLRTSDELTGADQDAYFDAYDEIMASKPRLAPQPDPANPAVMLPAEAPKLSNADGRALRDRLIGTLVTAWSFDLPLPYGPESRKQLPVRVCNALVEAIGPMQDALNGTEAGEDEGPKSAVPSGSGGSEGTSPAGSGSLPPAPPAVPSATQ